MTKSRIPETASGIQGQDTVELYDQMQRRLRDKGWIAISELLEGGVDHGDVLEVGPGPGYLGLEWLSRTKGTHLTGLDLSADMIELARHNATEYGLAERAGYVIGDAAGMPFDDEAFDAIFSSGSLHEWADPIATLDEMWRTLRPGGTALVLDMRRDMVAPLRWFLWINALPRQIRPWLLSSIRASYTAAELRELIAGTGLSGAKVTTSAMDVALQVIKLAKPGQESGDGRSIGECEGGCDE